MKGTLARTLIAVGLLAFVSACSQTGGSNADKQAGGTVTIGISGDIAAVDPAFAYDFTTNPVVNEITEGLLRLTPAGAIESGLAETWKTVDPVTYEFTLRKGLVFSDASPVSSDDVVYSLNRIRDPKTASYLSSLVAGVKDVKKIDYLTVQIVLDKPDAMFKYVLATTAGHVISKKYAESVGDKLGKAEAGVVGTGPYVFKSWQKGTEVVLEKNTHYWDSANPPAFDKAVFKIISDGSTRVTGLKTGELDAIVDIPFDLAPLLKSIDTVSLQSTESFGDDWIALNTSRAPLDDLNVRKAIIQAFDVESAVKALVGDNGTWAKNLPVGSGLFTFAQEKWKALEAESPLYPYNLEKAKASLAASKSPKGFKIKVVIDSNELRKNIAQAFQADLKKIGIDVEIVQLKSEELQTVQYDGKHDYDIVLGGWGADFPDPAANIEPFIGPIGANFANYHNAEVDALIQKAKSSSSDGERADFLIDALKKASADATYIFYDHAKVFFAANKKFAGYVLSPLWYWDSLLRTAYKTK